MTNAKKLMVTAATGAAKLVKTLEACVCALGLFVGNSASAGVLPPEYQEVAYVESTGTQYINTGIVPNSSTRVVINFAFTEKPTAEASCGWASSGSKEAFMFGADASGWYANVSPDWKGKVSPASSFDLYRHTFDVVSGSQKFDGTEFGTGTIGNTATSGQTLYLFACHVEWLTTAAQYPMKARIYSCQIYSGETLVRDFIPCYLISDETKVGLYDVAGSGFYTASGLIRDRSGVFVAGEPGDYAEGGSPVYGFIEKSVGDAVSLTAPDTVSIEEGKRAYCTGWKLYDTTGQTLLAESDVANRLTCSFEYSEKVRLVWQWKIQHLVTIKATGGLTVTPASQWVDEGGSVTFTADNEVLWTGEGVDPSTRLSRTCTVSGVTAATLVSAAALPICYLSPNGAGLKDGSSWENAFSAEQLQDAIGTVATTNVLRMMTGDYPRAGELTVAAGSIVKLIGGFAGKGESRDEGRSVIWRDGTTTCRLFNVSKSTVHMDGLVVSNGSCTAMNDKGMGVLAMNSELVFTDCVFTKNGLNVGGSTRTDHWGGAIYQEGGSLVVTRCAFRDNQLVRANASNCQLFGGAVYAKNVSSAFLGCTFTNNAVYSMTYYHNGGALSLAGSGDAVISNCTFVGNYTQRKDEPYYPRAGMGSGGAVEFSAGTAKSRLRICDSCFDGCYTRANGGGGGVLNVSGANHVTTLERVVIRNSGVQDDVDSILNHGEISLASGTLAMTNVLIATNFGSNSVIVANGKLDAVNCTIVGAKNGCGVQAKGGATTIVNSILWGNANGGAVATGGTLDLSYCDSQDGADADARVISADPKLNGPSKARAFMLRRGSPCVDAGDPSMWTAGDLDLAGNPRLRNGKVDLGCYSFNAPGLMLMLK